MISRGGVNKFHSGYLLLYIIVTYPSYLLTKYNLQLKGQWEKGGMSNLTNFGFNIFCCYVCTLFVSHCELKFPQFYSSFKKFTCTARNEYFSFLIV